MNIVKLGNFVEIDSGYAFKSSLFNDNEGIPIIRIRDVNSGKTSTYYSGDYDEKFLVNNGDLLITMDGEFNIREWSGGIALLNQRVCRIKSNSNLLNQRYLLYLLPKILKNIEDKTPFVTVKHLSVKDIAESEVFIPSVLIQEKIVKTLDIATGLINKRKEQINLLNTLIQGVFYDMFGEINNNKIKWDMLPLSELIQIETKTISITEEFENYQLIGIDNIEKDSGELINIKTVKESSVTGNKYSFSSDHILYSKIRPYLNKVALPQFDGLCSTDAYPLRVNEQLANKKFIAFILRSKAFVEFATLNSKGANIPRIDKTQLLGYKTIYPNIELQNSFGKKFDFIQSKIRLLESSLNKLECNLQSLTHKAFNGELFSS